MARPGGKELVVVHPVQAAAEARGHGAPPLRSRPAEPFALPGGGRLDVTVDVTVSVGGA